MNDEIHKAAKMLNERIARAMKQLGELSEYIGVLFDAEFEAVDYSEIMKHGKHLVEFESDSDSVWTVKKCHIYEYNDSKYMITFERYCDYSGDIRVNVYKERKK